MKGIIAVDIIPDTPSTDFFGAPIDSSAQTIRGKIRVVLSKPLKLKRVELKLRGTNRVHLGSLDAIKAKFTTIVEVPLVTTAYELIQILPRTTTLPEGVTDLPFEVPLKGDTPATFKLEQGYNEYKLTAIVVPAAMLDSSERYRHMVQVNRFLVPNFHAMSIVAQQSRSKGKREGVLKYQFDVPTILSLEQGDAILTGTLTPVNGAAMPSQVTVTLEEILVCRVASKDPSRPDVGNLPQMEERIVRSVANFVQESLVQSPSGAIDLAIGIPFNKPGSTEGEPPQCDLDTPLVDVTHQFHVHITFAEGHEKDMRLTFPVVLTMVPPKEEEDEAQKAPPSYQFAESDPVPVM